MENRTEKLEILLGKLRNNRDLMAILLENVKTEHLEEAFETFVKNLNNKELFILPGKKEKEIGKKPKVEFHQLPVTELAHVQPHRYQPGKYEVRLVEEEIKLQKELMAKLVKADTIDINTEADEVLERINLLLKKLTPADTLTFLTDLFKNLSEKREVAINTLIKK
jgi:hypothetical protein